MQQQILAKETFLDHGGLQKILEKEEAFTATKLSTFGEVNGYGWTGGNRTAGAANPNRRRTSSANRRTSSRRPPNKMKMASSTSVQEQQVVVPQGHHNYSIAVGGGAGAEAGRMQIKCS